MKSKDISHDFPFGYAHHKIITDSSGIPIDYRFIKVNKAFKKLTGLNTGIIGKTVREVIPGIENDDFDWIGFYGEIALKGGNKTLKQYSKSLDMSYQILAFSEKKGYFTTVFVDIPEDREEKLFRNALLAAQQEASLDGILAVGQDGKMILHNKRFTEIWKIPPDILATKSDELMIKSIYKSLSDPEAFMDKIKYLYDHIQESSCDEILLKDGRTIDRYSAPLLGPESQYYGRIWFFRDITEQKKTATELQRKKDQLDAILSKLPAVIFSYTIDKKRKIRLTYLNKNVTRILGFKPDEFIGHEDFFMSHIHPDDKELARKKIQELLLKQFIEFEYRFKDKNENYHWISDRHKVISQAGGLTEVIGTWVDITELKQTEEQLQNERNKLKSIIDAMEDGLTFQDKNYNIIFQNRISREYYEGIGQKCYKVYEGRDSVCEGCPVQEAYMDGKSHTTERVTTQPSGKIIYWENTASPIRNSQGEVTACLEITRNITHKKNTLNALQENELRLKNIFKAMTEGLVLLDPKGEIVTANPAAEKILGLKPSQTAGKNTYTSSISELFDSNGKSILPEMTAGLLTAKDKKPVKNMVTGIKRLDGTTRWLNVNTSPIINRDGELENVVSTFADITELRSRESLLQQIISTTPDGFFLTNPRNMLITKANKAFCDMLDYDEKKILTLSVPDIEYIEKPEDTRKHINNIMKKGYDRFETIHRKKDGSLVNVEISVSYLKLEGEEPSLVSFVRNITERKQAEELVKQSEAQLQQIISTSPDGFHIIDLHNNHITKVNKAFCDMLGYSEKEILKLSVSDIEYIEKPEETRRHIKDIIKKGYDRFESIHRKKDGSLIDVDISISYVGLEGKEPYIVAFARDITERKQTEEAIRKSESRLQQIISTTPDGFYIITPSDAHIIMANTAFCDMLGYSEEEILTLSIPDIEYTEKPEDTKRHIENIMQQGYDRFETVQRKKDGTLVNVEVSVSYVELERDEASLVSFVRDITERKMSEKTLQAAKEEAEAAYQAKSEFLANMSHEIRTPMNAVIGLARLMLTSNDLNTQQRETMLKINNSSKLLLGIINDILDYSKIEAGKLELDNHLFYLEEILTNLKSIFNDRVNEKGLVFNYDLSPDIPEILYGDSLRLSQILTNLLGNAIKFTEKGYVELRVRKKREDSEQCTLHFEVRDTGTGISYKEQKKLFQAFTQADTSTTRKYGGTGLGLVISNKMVEIMQGKLWLKSVPGKGSNFIFEIPFKLSSKAASFSTRELKKFSGMQALVVDDQKITRNALRIILEQWDISVTEASFGQKAVDMVIQASKKNSPFDLIIMDWKMPGKLDGIQAVKKIRNFLKEETSAFNIPVFIISAYKREKLDEEKDEFNAFINKPVTASVLYNTLNKAISSRNMNIQYTSKDTRVPVLSDYSVLLAEDNDINKEVAVRWLNKTGISIDLASDGQDAVKMSKKNKYDLILMDLQMPNMDGLEAAKLIRSSNTQIPIIALSAAVMEEDIKGAKEAGMNGHIKKPIDEKKLYQVLSEWLLPKKYSHKKNTKNTLTSFTRLKGFDLDKGLKSVDNNVPFYKKLLLKFKKQLASDFKNFLTTIKNNNKESISMAHALKGISSTVGAMDLYEICYKIETAYKHNETITSSMQQQLEDAFQTVQSSLEIIEDTKISEARKISKKEAAKLIPKLKTSLKEFAIIDEELLLPVCAYFEKLYNKDTAQKLKGSVENFDYDNALKILNKWTPDE